jgi:hypothetical protein
MYEIPYIQLRATKHYELLSDLGSFISRKVAVATMREDLSGCFVCTDNNELFHQTGRTWIYRCSFKGEDKKFCCGLRSCVRRHVLPSKALFFTVWIGRNPSKETDPLNRRDRHSNHSTNCCLKVGLPLVLRSMLDELFPKGKRKDYHINAATQKVKQYLMDDCDDKELNQIPFQSNNWERLKVQIKTYLKYKISKAGLNWNVRSVNDIINCCNDQPLTIPPGYESRDDYKLAKELATALGMESVSQCCLVYLGSGDIMDHICESWDQLWIDEYFLEEKRI